MVLRMFSPRRGDAGVSRLAARGAGVAVPGGVFGLDLVLLLVVEEVAARPVGAVARDPVLLTPLGLVLTVLADVTHLLEKLLDIKFYFDLFLKKNTKLEYLLSMSKLAQIPVQAVTFLLKISANLGFESCILTIII